MIHSFKCQTIVLPVFSSVFQIVLEYIFLFTQVAAMKFIALAKFFEKIDKYLKSLE